MKLPSWFPETPRPHNPGWAKVWDSMSREERQRSCAFDIAVVCLVLAIVWFFP